MRRDGWAEPQALAHNKKRRQRCLRFFVPSGDADNSSFRAAGWVERSDTDRRGRATLLNQRAMGIATAPSILRTEIAVQIVIASASEAIHLTEERKNGLLRRDRSSQRRRNDRPTLANAHM
jgi:hypothetical protein